MSRWDPGYRKNVSPQFFKRQADFKGKWAYSPPVEIPQKWGLWSSIHNALKAMMKGDDITIPPHTKVS